MDNKFLCVMAGYDDITEDHLASLQNKLYEKDFVGTHTKKLPQHITLGTFSIDKEEELYNLIKKVANETEPFKITFNHIGVFRGSNVLFIAPDPNKNLLNLKENFGDSFNWTPHTTMLIDHADSIYAALPIVVDNFAPFEGYVQKLHLYEFWPTQHILSMTFTK